VMGVDAREGEAIDVGVRPDSLMVLRLNSETGACRVLGIPRDTRVDLPGYGLSKVNHALAVGGIAYQKLVVERFLGTSIDHYVLLDFDGFESLVDAVGGVEVEVATGFVATDGTVFDAGWQKLDGKRALSYARWRGGEDGDFGRIGRQQQVLRALLARASGLNVVRSIGELLPAVEAHLRTDLSPGQMNGIAGEYGERCTEETVTLMSLEGGVATHEDPLFKQRLSYVEVDAAELRRKVAALMEP
jgi:polyisoprenyl-teichoic acid--peptidoglycan teichoic acid transferase